MYKFLCGHVVFAHVPQSGVAGSCGYSVLKGTVLSHPVSREAARKGEVIKKVNPGKGGVSRVELENTRTLAGRETHGACLHLLFYSSLSCSYSWCICDVTTKSWIVICRWERETEPN